MQPSHEIIEEFKRLYTKEFSEELSDAEAYERFSRLVNVLRVICSAKPAPPLDNNEGYDSVPRNHR